MGQRSVDRRRRRVRKGPAPTAQSALQRRRAALAAAPDARAASATAPGASATDAEPAALVVTHRFDSGPAGGPTYDATIHLSGHRRGVTGRPTSRDSFSVTETVPGIVPGSGPVSATSWIYSVAPGEWDVTAELLSPERARAAFGAARLPRAAWSWRSWSLRDPRAPARTRWALLAPLAAAPAVLPGSFTALAVLAIVAAVVSQPLFLGHERIEIGPSILASLMGLLFGVAGAKGWYMGLKGPSRETLKEGWSVDGFLLAAPLVAVVVALGRGLPLGAYLDAVAPGIFLAVAIGRVGCFLTGCCAGRPTARWGLWSSDRRVGARRIPTQLFESALGLTLAFFSAGAVLGHLATGSGLIFLVAVSVYGVARQGLLRLRAESRAFSWRRAAPSAQAHA